jgi:hypothetical protein
MNTQSNSNAGSGCPATNCSALQKCAERVAGHIVQPLDIHAIVVEIDSDEYNAELMLQHLLLWAAKNQLKNTMNDTPICPTTAALGRAILHLESESGKYHIEASLARSNGDYEHARFFMSRASQSRDDARMLSELITRDQTKQ